MSPIKISEIFGSISDVFTGYVPTTSDNIYLFSEFLRYDLVKLYQVTIANKFTYPQINHQPDDDDDNNNNNNNNNKQNACKYF